MALLIAAWAPQARAQGARKDDIVINGAGQPVGGASVAVCNATATIGTSATPCSPLVTIYTDSTLSTASANPFTADGLGNYGFWAPPGTYQVQVYGPQIATTLKTVVLPCVPGSSCAGGGMSSPSAAIKPGATDAVQYVSPNGNDSNDGLSMGSAKLTIMAAYDALGQGGGTIYITGSSTSYVSCTSTAGQGIWIMGTGDPNYSSPPAGWRQMKIGGPVYFEGLSANASPAASTTSWTTVVNCGNNSNPGVWLSGVSGVTISRLRMVSESVRVSMDSNGGRNNAANPSAQIEFDHDDFRSDCSGCGPTMDIGGNMLWLNVHDSTFENGAIANWSVSANSSQASNISITNSGGSGAIGLLYFTQNFFTGGGGLRFDANTNGSASVYAAHTLMEGAGACQPVYEIINGGTFAATFDLQGGFSDCGGSPPFVKVAAGNQPCQTSVRGINQGGQVPGLEGPLTVGDATCPGGNPSGGVSVADAGVPSAGVIPAAKGQSGGAYGTSQYADSYRRSFAPGLVRFANTANQLPSSWTAYQGSGQTLTQIQGPGDPAGSTNAATLSCTGQSGFGCSYYAFDSSITFNAGDYVYVGAWMQAASTAGFGSGSAIGVIFPFGNSPTMRQMTGGPAGVGGAFSAGTTQLSSSPYLQNDGNWQYVWGLSKITAPSSGASGTVFAFAFQPGYPINIYAPMFVKIPASSVALVSAPTFSSASESGNIVTFTTSAAHNLSRGEPVIVSGCSIGGYNGEFVLGNTISSTTFTVYNSATGLGSPTGCILTPENDSEVADWANNLKPYSNNCAAGTLCGVVSNPPISTSGLNNILFVDGVKNATIAAAVAAIPAGGATVYVPSGTYTLSGTVTLPSNARLLCADAAVITRANGGGVSPLVSFAGSDHAASENCTYDMNRAGNTDNDNSVAVSLSGSTNATLIGNRFRNGNNAGVYTGTGTNPTIQRNHFQNFWASGLELGFTGSTVATNGHVEDNYFDSQANLVTSFSDGNDISRNHITGYGQASNVTTSGTAVTWVSGTNFTNLSPGMYLVTASGGEIIIASVNSSTSLTLGSSAGTQTNVLAYAGTADSLNVADSSNNTLANNIVTAGEGYGLVFFQDGGSEATLHNTATGNVISKMGGSCVAVNSSGASPTLAGTALVANTVSDCGQAGAAKGASVNREGIELNGSGTHYTSIVGNNVYDDQGSATTQYGVINQTSPTDQLIGLNTIIGMTTAPVGGLAAPSIASGFGTSPSIVQQNGPGAFEINVGTGGTATSGVIALTTANAGWSCTAIDMSSNIVTRETASTTTSVTLTAASAWAASDKLLVNCGAF